LGLANELAEGGAEAIFDLVQGAKDAIADVVFAHVPPERFNGIKFGTVWGQKAKFDRRGQAQWMGAMPARPIHRNIRICSPGHGLAT